MQNFFKKKEKQRLETKPKKSKVRTVSTRKKSVTLLWILLIGSLAFGIYKNFTAIDQHTVHEREIIETRIIDTNAIESFTKNFVKDYYTWKKEKDSTEQRAEKINDYLTDDLQALNTDTIRDDIPTSSSVSNIDIWSVTPEKDDTYAIVYSVDQKVTEDKSSERVQSTHRILLHQEIGRAHV